MNRVFAITIYVISYCLISLQQHLSILMRGLKDYLPEQNREVIENAIRTLKEELDFEEAAINQLYLAIYLFQEAVSIIMR
jgi:mitogen-activated protein kinase kinase kinase 5